MQMNRSFGYIMFLAGAFILLLGSVFPMVIVKIPDTTPPYWNTATDGSIALSPKQGDVVTANPSIYAGVSDPESGVVSVVATIDSTAYNLAMSTGTAQNGAWVYTVALSLSVGSHTIKYVATNGAGLTVTAYGGGTGGNGAFTVYTALAGNWYVNDVLITSATQVITATSATVAFKFVKAAGVADSSITAFVKEGSITLVTLTVGTGAAPSGPAGTWTGSYTFSYGTHTLALEAYDGTSTITMSIIGLQFGSTNTNFELPQLNLLQILGLASTSAGLLLLFIQRRRQK